MILDFASPLDYFWALLPEVVLSVTALIVLLGDVFGRGPAPGPSARWVPVATYAGLLGAGAAATYLLGVEAETAIGMIAVDRFRVILTLTIIAATLICLMMSSDELKRRDLAIGEYYFLILASVVGMTLLTAARDLIVVFVAVELMSIAVYVLVGLDRRSRRSAEAAIKYFLMGAFASAFLLYGITLLFGSLGSTNLALVGPTIADRVADGDLLLQAGVALLLVGLGFKISAVPFHMWTPDAYEGAPSPVTAFMAAGVKAAGFATALRIVLVGLAPAQEMWHGIVWWLAILTMILPNVIALQEDNVKRMLAYSSVAHAGYLLVGLAAASRMGVSASIFYLAIYAVMTVGAFTVVAVVAGSDDAPLSRFRGIGWTRPWLAATLLLCLLSLAGFPPTGGFIGKFYLVRAAVGAGEIGLAVTLVLTSLLSYYYYLRVVWKMYFDEAEDVEDGAPASLEGGLEFRVGGALVAATILVAGLFPGPGLEVADDAGSAMVDASQAAVLESPATEETAPAGPPPRAN